MPERVPRCPRCKYDLSGVAESWQTACPLRGVCSECGRKFYWADAFTDKDTRGVLLGWGCLAALALPMILMLVLVYLAVLLLSQG